MPKKKFSNTSVIKPILIKDLREGKFKSLPAEKFAGNVFMMGKRFYEVRNNGAWRRIKDPLEVKGLLMQAGILQKV